MRIIYHSLKSLTLLQLKLGLTVSQLRLDKGAIREDGKYKSMTERLQGINKLI